jgi:hypothetical protein
MFLWQIRKHERQTNGNKTSAWWLYVSRKERREHKGLFALLFTLTLEWSQVSLRLENAKAG